MNATVESVKQWLNICWKSVQHKKNRKSSCPHPLYLRANYGDFNKLKWTAAFFKNIQIYVWRHKKRTTWSNSGRPLETKHGSWIISTLRLSCTSKCSLYNHDEVREITTRSCEPLTTIVELSRNGTWIVIRLDEVGIYYEGKSNLMCTLWSRLNKWTIIEAHPVKDIAFIYYLATT